MDAWFAGFHRNRVAVVWMGYDAPRKLGDSESGGGLALPVWISYMAHALQGVPVTQAVAPDGLVRANGEWYFEEAMPDSGIVTLGVEETQPDAPDESERRSILDLFK
jgi:penicillin-binding protein 1A